MGNTTKLCVAVFIALPLACAKKQEDTTPPSPAPEPTAKAEPADTQEFPDKDPGKAGIVIDPKIAETCNVPTTQFEFDSSALSTEAEAALTALATCFADGPFAKNSMKLVGHADPRGTEEYNLALGQRRAGGVAGYLTEHGLGQDRLETSSRGELDAQGADEQTWALDRKVEIFLAE